MPNSSFFAYLEKKELSEERRKEELKEVDRLIETAQKHGNYVVDNPHEAVICPIYTEAKVSKRLVGILGNSIKATQESI